jgi:exosortase A
MKSGTEAKLSAIIDGRAAEEAPTLRWPRPALFAVSSLVLILALFWQTSVSLVESWRSSRAFSHGFLIVPLFLYLVWMRRERILWIRSKPNFLGLPLLTALGFVWLLGNLGEIRVLQQFALVSMLVAAIWTVLGTDVVRALRFPLAFLFFAVPFGESIVGSLQDITAWFAVTGLRLTNIPTILENRTIYVPSGGWSVAEACSGIRYLTSSVVLGLIFASVVYRSWKRRVAFMIAAIVVPIVANGFRAYGIVLLGHLSNNKLAVGVDHIIYGWIFFTVIQLFLFGIGLKWRESPDLPLANGAHRRVTAWESADQATSAKSAFIAALCAVVLVGSMPLLAGHFWSRTLASDGGQPSPSVSLPWQPVATYDTSWVPYLHPDGEASQSYVAGTRRVDLYLARYSNHRGLELVAGYNLVANPNVWFGGTGGFKSVVIDGQSVTVQQRMLRSTSGSRVVWIWYWVAGEYTANPERVKFLQAKTRLLNGPAAAAVIALGADYQEDSSEAQDSLQNFLLHTSLTAALCGSSK